MKSTPAVLVCVTGQRDCDRLIHAGSRIANQLGAQVQVLCVQSPSRGHTDYEELEYLRQTAKEADAEMSVYFNDEAAYTAAVFARKKNAVHIVTGIAEAPMNGFVEVLHSLLPKLPIAMVAKDGKVYNICPKDAGNCPRPAFAH